MTKFLVPSTFEKLKTIYDHIPGQAKPEQSDSPFAASLEEFLEISGSERQL